MNEPTSRYKLLIAYDGTRYSGWQTQPNALSIQTQVEKAVSTALHVPTKVIGSGRTDQGVHALEQVAHFDHQVPIHLDRLCRSLNGLLPFDIRIKKVITTPADFHARYSAKSKIYRYYLHLAPVVNPFKRLYSYHLPYPIDRQLLQQSAHLFIGTHDFTSFSNEAHRGSASRDAVRTILRIDIIEKDEGLSLEFEADGFLYKMVRNIVGTLLDIARGKLPLAELESIFQGKNRSLAGPAAPAHGLFLVQVKY